MNDQDLLRCPLLQGLDRMHRAELIGLLNDSGVREKLEKCLAEHISASEAVRAARSRLCRRKAARGFRKASSQLEPATVPLEPKSQGVSREHRCLLRSTDIPARRSLNDPRACQASILHAFEETRR